MKRSMSGKDWFLAGFTTLVGAGKIDDGFREHKGTGTAVLGALMSVAGIGWLISGYQEWRPRRRRTERTPVLAKSRSIDVTSLADLTMSRVSSEGVHASIGSSGGSPQSSGSSKSPPGNCGSSATVKPSSGPSTLSADWPS